MKNSIQISAGFSCCFAPEEIFYSGHKSDYKGLLWLGETKRRKYLLRTVWHKWDSKADKHN